MKFLIVAGPGFFVKALGIARHADLQRRIDEYLDELAATHQFARHAALGPEGRDEGHQNDQPGIEEQFGGLADAADILHPVGVGEAQVAVEAVADIVAIQQIGMPPFGGQGFSPPDWRWSIFPIPTGR